MSKQAECFKIRDEIIWKTNMTECWNMYLQMSMVHWRTEKSPINVNIHEATEEKE